MNYDWLNTAWEQSAFVPYNRLIMPHIYYLHGLTNEQMYICGNIIFESFDHSIDRHIIQL